MNNEKRIKNNRESFYLHLHLNLFSQSFKLEVTDCFRCERGGGTGGGTGGRDSKRKMNDRRRDDEAEKCRHLE